MTDSRADLVRFAQSLTDKEFTELFYEMARGRDTSDLMGEQGHFVLAEVALRDSGYEIDFISLPSQGEPWEEDSPTCQEARCSTCGRPLRSWAKKQTCPICGGEAYGT